MRTFDQFLATFPDEPGYLDWATFGPVSASVRDGTSADIALLSGIRASSYALAGERIVQAQTAVAELLGADADEVTLQPSSTHALSQVLYGLQGTVIAGRGEFPSISVTLERAAALSNGALAARWLTPPDGRITADAVAASLDDEVTAVAVSHVDFRTGYRTDLAALRDLLGPHRLLIVDAVQSFGAVDEDFSCADVVVGHAYKWLRAGRGTGFARFSQAALERIAPVLSGRTGAEGTELPVDVLPPAAASARAFTVSAPDVFAAGRLAVAASDVRDVGIAAVAARISDHVDRLIESADRAGIPVMSPRERARRAGIVVLRPQAPARLAAALASAGLVFTARGADIRVAPHAGTDAATLRQFDETLAAFGNETFTVS